MTQPLRSQTDHEQLLQASQRLEAIVKSHPQDLQSMELLKQIYFNLGEEEHAFEISSQIAKSYLQLNQTSFAILEYEEILRHRPEDQSIRAILQQIHSPAPAAPPPAATRHSALLAFPGCQGRWESEPVPVPF